MRDAQGKEYSGDSGEFESGAVGVAGDDDIRSGGGGLRIRAGAATKGTLTLVFNPTMPVGDAVAPRIDVLLRAGE